MNSKINQERFVIVLPSIRSAHNVGAVFRTADAAGADKIYLTGYTCAPGHPKLDKVALGAEKSVAWEQEPNPDKLFKKLKKQGFKIVALEQTKKSVNIYQWRPSFPLALVVGNEVRGVEKEILQYCDEIIELPMRGVKESLNVSIAAGIAIYEIANRIDI